MILNGIYNTKICIKESTEHLMKLSRTILNSGSGKRYNMALVTTILTI